MSGMHFEIGPEEIVGISSKFPDIFIFNYQ